MCSALTSALSSRRCIPALLQHIPEKRMVTGSSGMTSACLKPSTPSLLVSKTLSHVSKSLPSVTATAKLPPVKKAVRSCTVSYAICSVGQKFSRLFLGLGRFPPPVSIQVLRKSRCSILSCQTGANHPVFTHTRIRLSPPPHPRMQDGGKYDLPRLLFLSSSW